MTLAELERIEYISAPASCPCCDGIGAHGPDCTFKEDCPADYENMDIDWEKARIREPLFAWARAVLEREAPDA